MTDIATAERRFTQVPRRSLGGSAAAAVVASLLLAGAHGAAAQQGLAAGVPAETVRAFDVLFGGGHAGARAVHAKGVVVLGSFVAAPGSASLSRAAHLAGGTVPVVVRFSNFAGVPAVADGAAEASPRGVAIRFLLPDGSDTDIVAHSYDGFPATTPEEFLGFLRALAIPGEIERFAATRPAARAFLAALKPAPASYGTEAYFGVNAFRFTNAAGVSRYGRYRLVPLAGESHLTPEDAAARASDFLLREFAGRLASGPVQFRLLVQLASEGDAVADGSTPWPASRPTVELGTLSLRTMAVDQKAAQQDLQFTPTNLVGGIAPSSDPMLLARTQAYRVSAERRGTPE